MMVWGPQTSGTPKSEIGLFGLFLSRNFDALPGPGLGSAASYQATIDYLKRSDGWVKPIQKPWVPMLLGTWMFIPWQHDCGIGFDPYPHNIPRPVMLTWWTIPAAHTRIYVKSMAAFEKQSSHEFKSVSAPLWHKHAQTFQDHAFLFGDLCVTGIKPAPQVPRVLRRRRPFCNPQCSRLFPNNPWLDSNKSVWTAAMLPTHEFHLHLVALILLIRPQLRQVQIKRISSKRGNGPKRPHFRREKWWSTMNNHQMWAFSVGRQTMTKPSFWASSMGRADHFPCHTVCPRKYEFGKGISHVCLKTEEKWIQQLNLDLVQLGLFNLM